MTSFPPTCRTGLSWHSIRPGSRAGPLTSRSYSKKFTSNLQIFISLKLLKQTVFTLQKISQESRLHIFKNSPFLIWSTQQEGVCFSIRVGAVWIERVGLKSSTLFGLDAHWLSLTSHRLETGWCPVWPHLHVHLGQRMCGTVQCCTAAHVMFSPQTAGFSAPFPQSKDMHGRLVGENDNFESSDRMLQRFSIFLRNTDIPLFSPLTSIFWCLCLVVAFRH